MAMQNNRDHYNTRDSRDCATVATAAFLARKRNRALAIGHVFGRRDASARIDIRRGGIASFDTRDRPPDLTSTTRRRMISQDETVAVNPPGSRLVFLNLTNGDLSKGAFFCSRIAAR